MVCAPVCVLPPRGATIIYIHTHIHTYTHTHINTYTLTHAQDVFDTNKAALHTLVQQLGHALHARAGLKNADPAAIEAEKQIKKLHDMIMKIQRTLMAERTVSCVRVYV